MKSYITSITETKKQMTMNILLPIAILIAVHDFVVQGQGAPDPIPDDCVEATQVIRKDPEVYDAFLPFDEYDTLIVSNDYSDESGEFDTKRFLTRQGYEGYVPSDTPLFDLRAAARNAYKVCQDKKGMFRHVNIEMNEPGVYDDRFGSAIHIVNQPVCLSPKCQIGSYIKNYHYTLGRNRTSSRIKVTSGCEERPWDRFFMKTKKKKGKLFVKSQACSWIRKQWPKYRAKICDPNKRSYGEYDNAYYACPSSCCACHEVMTDEYYFNGGTYTCKQLAKFGGAKKKKHCANDAKTANGLSNAITTCATTCGICPKGYPLPGTPITV